MMQTHVWMDARGQQYAEGPNGATLNDQPVAARPEWVAGPPRYIFGPVVPWGGGDCPVHPDKMVRLLFRGSFPYIGDAIWKGMPDAYKDSIWLHAPAKGRVDPNEDVIGYQELING